MAVMKKRSAIEDPFAKPVKKITSVPKKVVEAKIKRNKKAPKSGTPSTGNVKVVPPKKKTPPRGSTQKGGRSSRGGARTAPIRGGGMRGGAGGGLFDQIK